MMTKHWDVVIVGGGLAGYVAALFLAKANVSVLLVEKGKRVGGRARTDVIKEHYFNLGPHALYKQGKAKPILDELGVMIQGNSPKLGGLLIEGDKDHIAPFSPIGIATTTFLNWRERKEWLAFMAKLPTIRLESIDDEETFQQWLMRNTTSRKVQSLVYALARLSTYCHAPEYVSAKVVVAHLKASTGGVLYLDGGWQSMIDQLHNQAVVAGVHIRTQAQVKQIVAEKDRLFTLTLANGEAITSKKVVYTANPKELPDMLQGETLEPTFFDRLRPVTGAALDVALTTLPNPKRLFALGTDQPLYYSVHSNYAKLSKTRESVVLHVFKYSHPDELIDRDEVKAELEQFLERVQPGWRSHLITRRCLPHITVNHRLPQVGDEKELTQLETSVSGLYLAGDWASPDSVLANAAVSSGKRVALEITEKER